MSIRTIKIGIATIVLVPTIVLASWVITESMIQETSGEEFCGSCHTMTPMVVSYRRDIHGGAGDRGVQAKCTGCHIPHNNTVNYMFMKARFGMHDAWAQLTYDLDAIDWQAKRAHSEDYVFDSGCLNQRFKSAAARLRSAAVSTPTPGRTDGMPTAIFMPKDSARSCSNCSEISRSEASAATKRRRTPQR